MMLRSISVLCGILIVSSINVYAHASESQWNLPVELNDHNTTVRFEVDSTWHLVKGMTGGVQGEILLAKSTDPSSVIVELSIPVQSFDTDNSMRDNRMREVMALDKYKTVKFEGKGLLKGCTPDTVFNSGVCSDVLQGRLTILATTKEIALPIVITADEQKNFTIEGTLPFQWADYGIEDPSILIARLNPTVTVFFNVALKHRSN